jgi:hypothetical protein
MAGSGLGGNEGCAAADVDAAGMEGSDSNWRSFASRRAILSFGFGLFIENVGVKRRLVPGCEARDRDGRRKDKRG